mmetsp:Transcript_27318/g.38504  ORF Transcript_27318/g.38504 Transcript_27318/m.38504 type:complete len:274 (+) Transcript_27318:174-995(+)
MLSTQYQNLSEDSSMFVIDDEPLPPEIWNFIQVQPLSEVPPQCAPEPMNQQMFMVPDYFAAMPQVYRCDQCGDYIPFDPNAQHQVHVPSAPHHFVPQHTYYPPSFMFQPPPSEMYQQHIQEVHYPQAPQQQQQQVHTPPIANLTQKLNFRSTSVPEKPKTQTKRFEWTTELHDHFVKACELLGDSATPKKIMVMMEKSGAVSEGLTRLKVASHFQKYQQKTGRKPKSQSKKQKSEPVTPSSAPSSPRGMVFSDFTIMNEPPLPVGGRPRGYTQ